MVLLSIYKILLGFNFFKKHVVGHSSMTISLNVMQYYLAIFSCSVFFKLYHILLLYTKYLEQVLINDFG